MSGKDAMKGFGHKLLFDIIKDPESKVRRIPQPSHGGLSFENSNPIPKAADRIGVTYRDGERGQVITAQGTTNSYFVTLDQVTVGGITAHNVRAAIIDGAYPVEILLGMSFLSQVAIAEQGGVMTLTQKF